MPGPDAPPTCGRVPNAVAHKTTEWDEVTCGWCLKKRPNDTAKLVQALLENEARYVMPDEERERVIREAREALNPHIPLQVTNLFAISWKPCAPEFSCPRCKAGMERTTGLMLMSPWAGSVRCTKCEYRDSVSGYLGRSMIQVEPIPEGAVPIYDRELTQVQADEDAKVHAALDAVAANVGRESIREAEDERILNAMKGELLKITDCPRCGADVQTTPLTPPDEGIAYGCTRCPWPGGNP